jgi:serine/threonine protein kinase
MAPECVHNKPTTKASDMWSMGVILFQLYTGLCPFRGASDYLIFKLSLEVDFLKFEEYLECILPQEAKTLIKSIMRLEQSDRLSIDQVLQSPYFDGVRDLKSSPSLDDDH